MSKENNGGDSLGDRMKEYENITRLYLPKRNYIMIRIDGKDFHSFARGLEKPFDPALSGCMMDTMRYLVDQLQGCVLGYTQSDEMSFVLSEQGNYKSQPWFGGNLQKICSISASMATAKFNQLTSKIEKFSEKPTALFDARVWTISDPWEVSNYFLWRQQDATKNAISSAARTVISHKECQNKNGSELQEMLFQKGINFDHYPTYFKRGSTAFRDTNGEDSRSSIVLDIEPPIFSQDLAYIFKKLEYIDTSGIMKILADSPEDIPEDIDEKFRKVVEKYDLGNLTEEILKSRHGDGTN